MDDNDAYRDTLEFLMDRRDDVEVVGAISDGSSAATVCAELRAEVVVIDYRLPDLPGSVAAGEVRERCPAASVVLLSGSTGPEEREAARIAQVALVGKDEGVDALVGAVLAAAGKG